MTATPLTIYCGDARFLYQLLNTSPTILQDGAYCIKASTLCDEFIDCMDAWMRRAGVRALRGAPASALPRGAAPLYRRGNKTE